ncbi:HD domain-containing protein [Pigmentiphaga litoralis]|uniref:HD domain-containing protein n=1 Tax=Pigmentiphaga litoralis TaxID=516702 RepID=UPI00389B0917
MEIDRESLIRYIGGQDVADQMDHEGRADAIEGFLSKKLDEVLAAKIAYPGSPTADDINGDIETRDFRRGVGKIFRAIPARIGNDEDMSGIKVSKLSPMPPAPTLQDFFNFRFAPAGHLLQSAALARRKGASEEVILACLLHDVGNYLMKADHGYWSAQLIEPYVSERVYFAVRYHQALRFFADPESNYEYPKRYYRLFGVDYVPPAHILRDYYFAVNHPWYQDARQVTLNDFYAFDPDAIISVHEFDDIIGRHFRQPETGLGRDSSPTSHMWRTLINPDSPL